MSPAYALGAALQEDGRCTFSVWAPLAGAIDVHLVAPGEWVLALTRQDRGYFGGVVEGLEQGARYFYRIDGLKDRPDPASRFQPQGVDGPSQVMSPRFAWEDQDWSGPALADLVIYEIHVGVFTPEGTFDAIIPHLDGLREMGVTALELMPVAQVPGRRNWGYDGTYPFAVQDSYGGPHGLKSLVNACHQRGMAVVLDVVYNHLGPEGNYLQEFGPYFTDRHRTPWGEALNFDGPESDEVRHFFITNALCWVREFHVDALRLDAVHAIVDQSPQPFLAQLADAVHREAEELGRRVYLMAESDLSDARLIRSPGAGGYGLDAHWSEDFHHALHALLTGERAGYYTDFGRVEQLAKAHREGFVFSGQYSVFRRRRHGSSSRDISPQHFVVFAQNHDQVGNRPSGDRLSRLVSFEALKLAAGAVLLSPFIPLLFMGEEYGEVAPFLYFVSHSDPNLAKAVRAGRRREMLDFGWTGEPADPQAEETFQRSRLDHELRREGRHRTLAAFYRALLRLRKSVNPGRGTRKAWSHEERKVLLLGLADGWQAERALGIYHFGEGTATLGVSFPPGAWRKRLDSAEERWGGPGSRVPAAVSGGGEILLELAPHSFSYFTRPEKA
ncbi:MAG: malto-oligosyltrehalose trehalohydrolase [Thermodesulfobacteriota bacterium]